MARYYGDFRSLDTSTDPKGQKYRVLVFTGYTGQNPYEYRQVLFPTETTAGLSVPIDGTRLTMTDRPFVVTYEGDESNIYKPYRCSTAEVNFMQSEINLDFLNGNGTSTLVVLLKWKNEVSEVNGRMYNSITGETLLKRYVENNGIVLYNDYEPYKYDRFCHNVEWIGFSTPETFSMGYDHVRDVFTLNAQDAFSVLQYRETDISPRQNALYNALDILLEYVGRLGTYAKVYVTDTVKFNGTTDNAINAVLTQSRNYYDEDGKPVSQRETITRILQYLGLTAIPYRDNLIITTPNAIAEGWGNYMVYALNNGGCFMLFGGGTYTRQGSEYLSNSHTITASSHSGSTQIGTTNVFNSVAVSVEEYPVGCIIPEMGDDNNFERAKLYRQNFISAWGRQYSWERKVCIPLEDTFRTYQYPLDGWRQHGLYHNVTWQTQPLDTYDYNLTRNPSCYIIDDGRVLETENGTLPMNVSYSRKILFNTMPSSVGISTRGQASGSQDFDDKAQFSQTFLEVQSDNLVLNAGKWLNITGRWEFFINTSNPNPSNVDSPSSANNVGYAPAMAQYAYVWAKVRCGDKWLYSPTENAYEWVDSETFCKLWLNANEGDNAWGAEYSFRQVKRNIEGIMVKLPYTGVEMGSIQIKIDRPLGVSSVICHCATLTGFGVYVRESDDPDYWVDGNTEYETTIREGVIEEYEDVKVAVSSLQKQGTTYSQVVKSAGNDGIGTMPKVYNVATGNYALAEQQITENIASQYGTPTVNLTMALHNPVTPYTLLTWGQFPNRKFVVSSMEINYEYETSDVTICETKSFTPQRNTVRRNTTRNYRRNGDIVLDTKKFYKGIEPLNGFTIVGVRTIEDGSITTTDENEGNITIQPQFTETDSRLLVSVPHGVNAEPSVDNDGHLILTFND